MARKTQNTGVGAGAKVAILLMAFGVPCLLFLFSWGQEKLFEVAPWALIVLTVLVETAYTAYTAGLMYRFYKVDAPIFRFIPCVCEVSLIDVKYHTVCYILYVVALLLLGASQLPYSIIGVLGQTFATTAPYYLLMGGLLVLGVVQIIKGIGLTSCIKDIGIEWQKQTHVDLGAITKFSFLSFIPFVRVMALYSLNKPLSTLVDFRGSTIQDSADGPVFHTEVDGDGDEY